MDVLGQATVSRVQSGDWRDLRGLRLASLADAPRALCGDLAVETARGEPAWRAETLRGWWLIASIDGRPVGLIHCVHDAPSGRYYLESMWVSPRDRHRGVAELLLQRADDVVREAGARYAFLWVLTGNEAVEQYYQRRGFRPTGVRQPLRSAGNRIEIEYRRPLELQVGPA